MQINHHINLPGTIRFAEKTRRSFLLFFALFVCALQAQEVPSTGLGNPGFEEGLSSWRTTGNVTADGTRHGGVKGLKIVSPQSVLPNAEQRWTGYAPGGTYQLSFWGKLERGGKRQGRLNIGTTDASGNYKDTVTVLLFRETEWTKYGMTFSTTAISPNGLMVRCWVNDKNADETVYFDDFTITRVTMPVAKPSAPAVLNVSAGANALHISWQASGGSLVDGYKVSVSTVSGFTPCLADWNEREIGNVTEKTVGGLEDYTTYYVRVRARNLLTGDSTSAAETSARTADTRAPSAPTLDVRGLLNTVILDWSASTDIGGSGVAGYELDVSTSSTFATFMEGYRSRNVGLTTTFSLEGAGGKTYYARVRAYDGAGNRSVDSAVKDQRALGIVNAEFEESATLGIPGWGKTTGTSAETSQAEGEYHSGAKGLKITVTPGPWTSVWQDWKGYVPGTIYQLNFWGKVGLGQSLGGRVQVATVRADGTTGAQVLSVDVADLEWTRYAMTFSTNAASDGLRIRCYGTANTLSGTLFFDDFTITTVTTPVERPNPPTGLTLTPGREVLNVSWTAPNSLVDSYRVDVSTRSDFAVFVQGWNGRDVGRMVSTEVRGLEGDTRYYARVRANNRLGGLSTPSLTVNARTLDTVPPTVILVRPSKYGTVTASEQVMIEAMAVDANGIERVEFTIDEDPIGSDSEAPYAMAWMADSKTGPRLVKAAAVDRAGNRAETTVFLYAMSPTYLRNVRDLGATGDGLTDDTPAIQAGMRLGVPLYFPPGVYRVTRELAWGPESRNTHFIGSNELLGLMGDAAENPPVRPGTETVIRYDGPEDDRAAVLRASYRPVGEAPARNMNDSVMSLHVRNITVDANDKAGYGLYIRRAMSPTAISNVVLRKARKDGLFLDNTYYGLYEHIFSMANGQDGISIGQTGNEEEGRVNNTTWRDIAAVNNSRNGINAKFYRGNAMIRPRASNNGGANFVQQEESAYARPNTFDAVDPFAGAVFTRHPEPVWVNVTQFGAVPNDGYDDLPAIKRAMAENKPIYFPSGKYLVSDEIVVPSNKPNVAFVGAGTSQWPEFRQNTGSDGYARESTLIFAGRSNASKAVVRVSADVSQQEPHAGIAGFRMFDIGVDANQKAGYGLVMADVNNPSISGVSARGALKDGIYINKLNGGRFELTTSNNNLGNGWSIGKAGDEFEWNEASVNNTVFRVISAPYNGKDGQFRESDNLHGYGIGMWLGNNNTLVGLCPESNDGPNLVIGDWQSGNTLFNAYSEQSSIHDPDGAGPLGSALDTGRTSRPYSLWVEGSATSWRGPVIENMFMEGLVNPLPGKPSEWVRLTGSAPSSALQLKNVFLGTGILKDWSNVALDNVYAGLSQNQVDGVFPTVAFASTPPHALYTRAQTVPIAVTANDNIAVSRVELVIDGIPHAVDSVSPYEFVWNVSASANGRHALQVKVFDDDENSASTDAVDVTVAIDGLLPAEPNLEGRLNGQSWELNWTSVSDEGGSGVAGNEVDASTDAGFGTYLGEWKNKDVGPATTVTLEGLSGGTTYYARVRAYDAAGNRSAYSNGTEVRVTGLMNPGFEDGLSDWRTTGYETVVSEEGLRHGGGRGLKITTPVGVWPTVEQAWAGYAAGATYQLSFWGKIETGSARRGRLNIGTTDGNGNYKETVAAMYFSETEWTKYGVTFSTTAESPRGLMVRWWQDSKTVGGTAYVDDVSITTVSVPVAKPNPPTGVNLTAAGPGALRASWTAAGSVVDGYRVDVSTRSDFAVLAGVWSNRDVGQMTVAEVRSLEGDTRYFVRVRAYNRLGGTSVNSETKDARTLETLPPTAPVADGSSYGQTLTLSWSGSSDIGSGVSGYEVDVSTDAGFGTYLGEWKNKDVGPATTVTLEGLSGGTTYYARVRSYDGAGNRSAYSNGTEVRVTGLMNPGFEEGMAGWRTTGHETVVSEEGLRHGGGRGLKITTPVGVWPTVEQAWTGYAAGATYQLSFWGKVETGSARRGRLNIGTTDGNGNYKETVAAMYFSETEWTKYGVTFSTTAESPRGLMVRWWQDSKTVGGTAYVDDISITTVTAPVVKPNPPTGVNVTAAPKVLKIGWRAPAGSLVDGYRVSVSTTSGFTVFLPGWNDRGVGLATEATVSDLEDYTEYYVRVRAHNHLRGNSNDGGPVSARTPDTRAPSAPSLDVRGLLNTVMLDWSASTDIGGSGVAGYELDVSTSSTFATFLEGYRSRNVGLTTSFSLEGEGGLTYYARVRAYDGAGNRSVDSAVKDQRAFGIVNAHFEEATTAEIPGWRWTAGTRVAATRADGEYHDGSQGLKVTATTGTWQAVWQDWEGYVPGTAYQLSFWGKVASSQSLRGRVQLTEIRLDGTTGASVMSVDVTDPEWTRYSMSFSTDVASEGLRIRCYGSDNTLSGTMYFDDFTITTVTVPVLAPNPPTGVTMTVNQGVLNVTWTAPNSLVDSYKVLVSTKSDLSLPVSGWNNRDVGNMTTARVSGLKTNTVYYAVVRAHNRLGGLSSVSGMATATIGGTFSAQALEDTPVPPLYDTVDNARAYPALFQPGRGADGITFDKLPEETPIRIFTAAGQPVKSLAADAAGKVRWDLTNDEGQPVASGVYVVIIEKNGARKKLKVIVQK